MARGIFECLSGRFSVKIPITKNLTVPEEIAWNVFRRISFLNLRKIHARIYWRYFLKIFREITNVIVLGDKRNEGIHYLSHVKICQISFGKFLKKYPKKFVQEFAKHCQRINIRILECFFQ